MIDEHVIARKSAVGVSSLRFQKICARRVQDLVGLQQFAVRPFECLEPVGRIGRNLAAALLHALPSTGPSSQGWSLWQLEDGSVAQFQKTNAMTRPSS